MLEIKFSPTARRDLVEILNWSREQFGIVAQRRYRLLIKQALDDIATDPNRPGSRTTPELLENVRLYHLRHSRRNVADFQDQVKRPRHFLLFRIKDATLEIGRLLHDSMDFEIHYPEDFQAS